MFKYYRSAFVFTVIATALGYLLGGPGVAFIVLLLGVLETSLSFDNAVVNASILKNWDQTWRDRFVTFGMPVAVFGMRLVFPLIIVAVIAGIGPVEVVKLAFNDPKLYAATLTSAHAQISAFGGAFLSMIFLNFFLDQEKDKHWLSWFEKPLQKLGHLEAVQIAITLGVLYVVSRFQPEASQLSFLVAGTFGLITFVLAESLGGLVGGEEDSENAGKRIVRQGLTGLLYLELLDASFSFDGVMGSFAMSNSILVIALGLGVGAMFVRSMTIHLVEKGTLSEYLYLEHGAFWAIGALTAIMYTSTVVEVPEIVSGTLGAGLIGLALVSSIMHNRKEAAVAVA